MEAAVVLAGRPRRKDWVARREFQRDAASIEYTVGLWAKARAPCEQRNQLPERATIWSDVPKQRERSGDLQCSALVSRPLGEGADQFTPLRVADQDPRVAFGGNSEIVRVKQAPLNECDCLLFRYAEKG